LVRHNFGAAIKLKHEVFVTEGDEFYSRPHSCGAAEFFIRQLCGAAALAPQMRRIKNENLTCILLTPGVNRILVRFSRRVADLLGGKANFVVFPPSVGPAATALSQHRQCGAAAGAAVADT
jgi:hypothetical protein